MRKEDQDAQPNRPVVGIMAHRNQRISSDDDDDSDRGRNGGWLSNLLSFHRQPEPIKPTKNEPTRDEQHTDDQLARKKGNAIRAAKGNGMRIENKSEQDFQHDINYLKMNGI